MLWPIVLLEGNPQLLGQICPLESRESSTLAWKEWFEQGFDKQLELWNILYGDLGFWLLAFGHKNQFHVLSWFFLVIFCLYAWLLGYFTCYLCKVYFIFLHRKGIPLVFVERLYFFITTFTSKFSKAKCVFKFSPRNFFLLALMKHEYLCICGVTVEHKYGSNMAYWDPLAWPSTHYEPNKKVLCFFLLFVVVLLSPSHRPKQLSVGLVNSEFWKRKIKFIQMPGDKQMLTAHVPRGEGGGGWVEGVLVIQTCWPGYYRTGIFFSFWW